MPPKYPLPYKDSVHSRSSERSYSYYKMLVKAYNIKQGINGNPFRIPEKYFDRVASYLQDNKSDDVREALEFLHFHGNKF